MSTINFLELESKSPHRSCLVLEADDLEVDEGRVEPYSETQGLTSL